MEIEGKLTTHHQSIAEKLNTYCISVVDSIANSKQAHNTIDDSHKKDPLNYLYSTLQQSFTNIKLKNTTTGEIEKIITQLKNKNSCGYDEVTTQILKTVSPYIVSPLTYICNKMLATGTFLDRLITQKLNLFIKRETKLKL